MSKIFFKLGLSSLVFILIINYPAMSYSPFLDQAKEIYGLNSLKCEVCHISSHLNIYGKDFQNIWRINKNIEKTFLELNKKDSDGDGFSNFDEIKLGSNPGDKFSFPKK